jgi:hypothetical protein
MTTSEKITFAKFGINLISTIGVSKVVRDIIQNNTNVETTADAVKVTVGSFVIGGMVAEQASEHVNRRVDGAIAWYESRKDQQSNDSKTEYKSNR